MNETSLRPVPNPNIYLNYLHPAAANDYEAARNVSLVTLGILLWDIFSSIPDDWTLVRTTKPSLVLFAYFSSRPFALVVVILSMLMTTGPVENCNLMHLIVCIFWVLSSASYLYLFLKRVHAVYLGERLVCHAFTAFWIAAVGATTVLVPATLHSYYQIADTKHCVNGMINSYVAVAFYVPEAFDGFVYSAIAHKIYKSHKRATGKSAWKSICSQKALPRLSRVVLQGGQQYYIIAITCNLTLANLALTPTGSPIFQLLPMAPAVAITSAMACRVFRNLKLEVLQKTEVGSLPTIQFVGKVRHLPRDTETYVESSKVDLEHVEGGSET